MTTEDAGGVYDASIIESSGNAQADAECLEAICTCIPHAAGTSKTGLLRKRTVDFSDLKSSKTVVWHEVLDYFKDHPDQAGRVVIIHRVPVVAQKLYPEVLSIEEIHSVSNLMPISFDEKQGGKDYAKVIRHAGASWDTFFETTNHPSKGALLDCANKISDGE